MGQLTVGILFFKSPRPTGWLGKIGVRHWPHRFPSCGLNQLWLLASLSLSLVLSLSFSFSVSLIRISFSQRFLSLSLSTYAYIHISIFLSRVRVLFLSPITLASASVCLVRARTTYTFYFIPFRSRSHHAFNIVRPTLDWPIRNCRNMSLDEKIQRRPPTLSFSTWCSLYVCPSSSWMPWFPSQNLFAVSTGRELCDKPQITSCLQMFLRKMMARMAAKWNNSQKQRLILIASRRNIGIFI